MPADRPRAKTIALRPAQADDARYVWTTNNEPTVRAQSIQTGDIGWDDHVEWYRRRLARADARLFIGVEGDEPVGVVGFDVADGEAVISIAVEPRHRGRGIGQQLIALVTEQARAYPGVRVLVALIRPSNVASQHAFINCGYRETRKTEVAGAAMLRFEQTSA